MFLTQAQLLELTGYKRPAAQRRWLRQNGYPFLDSSNGRPVILRSVYEEIQSGERPLNFGTEDDGLLTREAIVAKAIPVKPVGGVYFLISGGRIVYVGKSIDVMVRLSQHLKDDDKHFDAYHFIEAPADQLAVIELAYIRKFNPCFNKQGNPDCRP